MTKRNIYIIDLIGNHSGMHYYHESFITLFKDDLKLNFIVLSNYSTSKNAFFPNIFIHGKFINIILLFTSWLKLISFILFHKKSHFVYLTYGCLFDIPFLIISFLIPKKFIVDIHEIYDLRGSLSNKIKNIFNFIYRKLIKKVIIHSEKTKQNLIEINYSGVFTFVPHFKYSFNINSKNVLKEEVSSLIISNKINILFFGHIRLSKGIDILIEMANKIKNPKIINKLNFVIAGNDTDNILTNNNLTFNDNINNTQLLRKITDQELDYLFKNSDYIILPYREISQSGIVEMAIKYKKPMILSRIPSFVNYINEFESFGHTFSLLKQDELEELLSKIIEETFQYYTIFDLNKYNNNESFERFKSEFKIAFLT